MENRHFEIAKTVIVGWGEWMFKLTLCLTEPEKTGVIIRNVVLIGNITFQGALVEWLTKVFTL